MTEIQVCIIRPRWHRPILSEDFLFSRTIVSKILENKVLQLYIHHRYYFWGDYYSFFCKFFSKPFFRYKIDAKLIRYQFWCTRCAFQPLKSLQWCSGRKCWKSEKKVKTERSVGWKPIRVPWNWAKSVEG
jgi:hypothetical protein